MGESVGTVAPVAIHIDNWANVSPSRQSYDYFGGTLRVEASGMNSIPCSVAYSATTCEKPIIGLKKKKKKKKGKHNAKLSGNEIMQARPVECDKNIRTSYFCTDNTSVCTCETNGDCLKDHCEPCQIIGNFVHSDNKSTIGDTIICGRDLKNLVPAGQGPKSGKKFSMNWKSGGINKLKENRSLGDLSQNMDSTMSSTFEDSHGGRTDKTELSSENPGFRNAYGAYSSGSKTRFEYSIQTGKENNHSVRHKIKKYNREVHNHGTKTLNHVYVPKVANLVEKNLLVNCDSFASNGLLPNPVVPSARRHDFAHQGMKNKQAVYRTSHCNVLAESSMCIADHRWHRGLSDVDSELMQSETCGVTGLGTLKQKRYFRYKHDGLGIGNKRTGDFNSNFLKSRNRTGITQRDRFEVQGQARQYYNRDYAQRSVNHNLDESHRASSHLTSAHVQLDFPHISMSGVVDTLLPGVQPYTSMMLARTEHSSVEALHDSVGKVQRHPLCSDFKSAREDSFREDFSSRVSLQKWVPVSRKDSEALRTDGVVYDCSSVEDVPDPCNENAALRTENGVSVSFSSVDSEKTCLIPTHDNSKMRPLKSETLQLDSRCKNTAHNLGKEHARYYPPPCTINATPLLCIGSQMAIKTMNASYQLQIISESIQLAVGSPLAEFEKLLQLASPVIASSSALQHCDICLRNPLPFSSLCKHQVANISLRDIWGWYEKPGNYGLEVRAEDWIDVKGMDIDSVSFSAHFVPFLSAVQLFSHSQKSNNSNDIRHHNSEIRDRGEEHSHIHIEEALKELENSPAIISADGSDISCLSSEPSCSSDMELVFEFFESEQPQQRKPLYDKVRDIIELSTSNHHVYGESSRLDCTDLHNIHPASWYAVAWYPIYRIPEGNFRASFLTYHSLGHFIHRCTPEHQRGDQYSVVSPALGMQSYNAEGECWFYPKDLVESSFRNSEILKQRLRTLEEAAVIFARGSVYKDHVRVTNRQPDYEFFLSRKR